MARLSSPVSSWKTDQSHGHGLLVVRVVVLGAELRLHDRLMTVVGAAAAEVLECVLV
jgi:hypothetical protein